MSKQYDVLVVGPVSLDHNIDYEGNERKELGGAVVASGFAAVKSGFKTALFTKSSPSDTSVEERFANSGADLYWKESKYGKVAVDVQCLLRHIEEDKTMAFHDWAEKEEILPYIDYLKTDAAEAEILTSLTDRVEAAKLLYSWGAKEVVISHNTEVIAYDGKSNL